MSQQVFVRKMAYDDIDKDIVEARMNILTASTLPNAGEFVLCKDGSLKRITFVYGHEWSVPYQGVCTTITGGTYYLGAEGSTHVDGHFDGFSMMSDLELTNETRPGDYYFYHHDTCYKITRVGLFRVWRERQ